MWRRGCCLCGVLLCAMTLCLGVEVREERLSTMPHWTLRTPQDVQIVENMGAEAVNLLYAGLDSCLIARNGRHVAAVVPKADGQCALWLDGKEGPVYRQIRHIVRGAYVNGDINFGPLGNHVVYNAKTDAGWVMVVDGVVSRTFDDVDTVTYSQDGKRLGYVAVRGEQAAPVVDGVIGTWMLPLPSWYVPVNPGDPAYEDATPNGRIAFSPDGTRLAYLKGKGRDANAFDHAAVMLDGKEGPAYTGIMSGVFSPDNRHFAYLTQVGEEQQRVVCDGTPGPVFSCITTTLVFSHDGARLAYVATADDGNGDRVVCDGKAGPVYDAIDETSLAFSRDGKHFVYIACKGEKYCVVADGVAGPWYDEIGMPSGGITVFVGFHPRDDRVIYCARNGNKRMMVFGTQKGPAYDDIDTPLPTFSADGMHYAYVAHTGDTCVVVEDGHESPRYNSVTGADLCFAPDNRVAYQANVGNDQYIAVIGGSELRAQPCNSRISFSPDGTHYAYFGNPTSESTGLILDGQMVVTATEIARFGMQGPVFDHDGYIRLLCVRSETTDTAIVKYLDRVTVKWQ